MTKPVITFDVKSADAKSDVRVKDNEDNAIRLKSGAAPQITCDGQTMKFDEDKMKALSNEALKAAQSFSKTTEGQRVLQRTDSLSLLKDAANLFGATVDRAHIKDDSSMSYSGGKSTTNVHLSGDVTLKDGLPSPLTAMCKIGTAQGILK